MNRSLSIIFLLFFISFSGIMEKVCIARKADFRNYNALWENYLESGTKKPLNLSYPYEHCFRAAAKEFSLPYSLLVSLAKGESNFNPNAKSKKSCYGLMQIQWPGTAKHLGINTMEELLDPCTNIRAGAEYLRELLERYNGNLHLSLAAYNYGPGRIRTNGTAIPEGAVWYSSYIYNHLTTVLDGAGIAENMTKDGKPLPYDPDQHLNIIVFNKPYRVEAFLEYASEKESGLRLEWFRTGPGRFQVVMQYRSSNELAAGKKMLGNLGFTKL